MPNIFYIYIYLSDKNKNKNKTIGAFGVLQIFNTQTYTKSTPIKKNKKNKTLYETQKFAHLTRL